MRRVLVLCCVLLLLGGCYGKPVRHLASDASLIKPDVSTRSDVLLYLGEPDGHRVVAPGVEEYVYYEDRKGLLGRAPVIGSYLDPEGYEMLVITLKGEKVAGCEFREFDKKDTSWMDDFTWEEIK
ncbi:hypothetical protein GF1_00050 [Desulfolithobacter dissulfuricans]|uniref:Lipoprotein n=1 Tax=Desulfolithobacter dissulfuricans TaxID=2795293 RepID=A0A915TYM3_9BACT|nr:hypothetical protein [Desulfolithobacter dissulfuricans]BCO07629.1 hypothetical protein GF1_00050 [Desulfolithobacter dissulfuricans]